MFMQPADQKDEETSDHRTGEAMLQKAMAGQQWVALGDLEESDEKIIAGRKVKDGILFCVAVSVAGRELIALIDSGASQCYISPDAVALCELECQPAEVHLELADGSKVQATQQTLAIPCTVGNTVCQISFTVTKLLCNVDVVLGMDWLRKWNPVIDWRKQIIYVWVHGEWHHINGVLLDAEQRIGTVKVFSAYMGNGENVPDFSVIQKTQFWDFKTDQKEWTSMRRKQGMTCEESNTVHTNERSTTVQKNEHQTSTGQWQLISSKQVAKVMRKGEPVYLALIRSTTEPAVQGLTQKSKLQKMKEKGPVRKAPPVAETRKRMCQNAPEGVKKELDHLLQEYAELFPEQLPKGKPPKRAMEFEIRIEEGATPPSKPPYKLSPKEHEELQAQINDLLV